MQKPTKPGPDASPKEIQEYLDDYEAWCEWKGAQKVAEMNQEREDRDD